MTQPIPFTPTPVLAAAERRQDALSKHIDAIASSLELLLLQLLHDRGVLDLLRGLVLCAGNELAGI